MEARGAVTIDNDDDDDDGQRTSVIVWMCFVTSSTSLDTPDCSSCPPPAGRMTHIEVGREIEIFLRYTLDPF